jgi:hypothetical protein
MDYPSTGSQTELQAVNEILSSVGQAPVTTLEQSNPDVAIAYQTLNEITREVQADGWTFNREYEYPFKPDVNNEIVIPNNVIQLSLSRSQAQYGNKSAVRRSGKLYERNFHTFDWGQDVVYCDVIWAFDWTDIPLTIQNYITARAATITSTRIMGDENLYSMLQQKEAVTRAQALEYDCNQGHNTFFGSPEGQNYYVSYQPFHALYR